MQLAAILNQYHDVFQAKYGSRLLPGHLRAIDAIQRCRTPEFGQRTKGDTRITRGCHCSRPESWSWSGNAWGFYRCR
jgi:hypothetical protein